MDLLVVLHRQLDIDDPTASPRPFDEGALRAAVAILISNPTLGCVWLMTLGDEVVGYLALTFGFSLEHGGRDAFLDELFVRADYREQGLGARAIEWAQNACHWLDVHALHLK